ncbi:MAG TPA: sulfotransferase domain-containing protein [Tepidisphaeraceae bacterium]
MRANVTRRIGFKVFGLQRTGTNLMAALLERNFHVQSLEPWTEWKHGPVRQPGLVWEGQAVRFILCVRDPYAWLGSCYRYFQKAVARDPSVPEQFRKNPSQTFEQFVTRSCYEFENPVDRWNRMNKHWWKALGSERAAVVRHEDQLQDQIPILENMERALELKRRGESLRRIRKRVDVVPGNQPVERNYFLNREYLAEYSEHLLDFVRERLDRRVVSHFGYAERVPV